jgi:hypothetical protein
MNFYKYQHTLIMALPTRCAARGGLPYQLDAQQEEGVLNRPEETHADGAIAG